jgi:hypothetical protein
VFDVPVDGSILRCRELNLAQFNKLKMKCQKRVEECPDAGDRTIQVH